MKRIVLSGGPCSGKTSALGTVKEYFEKKGLSVSTVSETATEMIREGLDPSGSDAVSFHAELIRRQILKEDSARECDILLCDRGAIDIKAYLTPIQFESVLKKAGYTEKELRERYYAVIHLVTAALGAEHAYSLSNNEARSESLEYAREVDMNSRKAWAGQPNYFIIDNSTDFAGKTDRVIAAIEGVLK